MQLNQLGYNMVKSKTLIIMLEEKGDRRPEFVIYIMNYKLNYSKCSFENVGPKPFVEQRVLDLHPCIGLIN